jgi:peptidylprolyl isomerase
VTVTAGCSSISEPSSCSPLVSSGSASTLVSATGDLGEAPTVSFPTPLISTSTVSSAISAGDGTTLYDGSIADVQASIYDGATGALLTATD